MQYAVREEPGGRLSGGAIAGIAVGSVVGLLAAVWLALLAYRRYKAARQLSDLKTELRSSFYGPSTGTSEVPTLGMGTHASEFSSAHRGSGPEVSEAQGYRSAFVEGGQNEHSQFYAHHTPENITQEQTPIDEDGRASMPPLQSQGNSPAEIPKTLEVQLARPQRLSRGYARIVYTQTQSSNGSALTDALGSHQSDGTTSSDLPTQDRALHDPANTMTQFRPQ
jgi:hypothetical protein